MKQVKLCGMTRECDILAVNEIRPDYCGFVVDFPKSRRSIGKEHLAELTALLDREIKAVGVFVNEPVADVAGLLNAGVIDIAQLHGEEDEAYIAALRAMTEKPVWQAFRVKSEEDILRAEHSGADMILLDAGQGGGRAFDWSLLNKTDRPFALAGGLNVDNLAEALDTNAVLLDVSGGVETDGRKDKEKMRRFVETVRAAK